MLSGVYVFYNKLNGKRYVGSSKNLDHRRKCHYSDLKCQRNLNHNLQDDYNMFGKDAFGFKIIELCPEENLIEREQFWMDKLQPEYNINKLAGKSVEEYARTDNALSKRVESWKRNHALGKHKKRNPVRLIGKDNPMYGKNLSNEQKKHLSEINTGERNPNWGLKRSKETRKKLSESNSKTYDGLVAPDGTIYAPIRFLSSFCELHGLGLTGAVAVLRGRHKQHKGWTKYIPDERDKTIPYP